MQFLKVAIIIACLETIFPAFAKHYSLPYDNIPISAKTWEEIDIVWPNKFNRSKPNHGRLLRPINYARHHRLVINIHGSSNEIGRAHV